MRLNVYRGKGLGFQSTVTTPQGSVVIEGDVNYRLGVGYAVASGNGSAFFLQWNSSQLLAWPTSSQSNLSLRQLPAGKPAARALAPTQTKTDALFALLLQLGQNRPDNAQLLEKDGARFVRTAVARGVKVDVIEGPKASGAGVPGGTIDYWLSAAGQLVRVDAALGGGAVTEVDVDPSTYKSFPVNSALQ
jgi:hypothetical protein